MDIKRNNMLSTFFSLWKRLGGGIAIIFLLCCLISCENDLAEVSKFIDDDAVAIEVGETVKMLYSDSGRVEMMIEAPLLHRECKSKSR